LAPGAGGVGGVGEGFGDFAFFQVLDVFPAQGDAGFSAVRAYTPPSGIQF